MSSSPASSGNSGSFTVGLSTARFLDQSMLEEVAPVGVSNPRPAPTPSIAPVAPPVPAKASEHSESDEEISSYMHQLLKRTGQAPAALGAATATPARLGASQETSKTDSAESGQAPVAAEEAPWTEAHYIPKKQAPEREADLRAFRQLANASARGALNSFQQKKRRKQNVLSGIFSLASVMVAALLYQWGGQLGDQWGLGPIVALAVGGVFGYRYHKSRGGLEK